MRRCIIQLGWITLLCVITATPSASNFAAFVEAGGLTCQPGKFRESYLQRSAPSASIGVNSPVASPTSRGAALQGELDPDSLNAVAHAYLLSDSEAARNRAIAILQSALRLTDRPAQELADLTAANLARSERTQSPRDLLADIRAAQRTLEFNPQNQAALYDLFHALERFGLNIRDIVTWRQSQIEYALKGDTLLVWTRGDTAARLARATISRKRPTSSIWPETSESFHASEFDSAEVVHFGGFSYTPSLQLPSEVLARLRSIPRPDPSAFLRRADARLKLGRPKAAAADLDSAFAILARTYNPYMSVDGWDRVRNVLHRSVMLKISASQPGEALVDLERKRAVFTQTEHTQSPLPEALPRVPPGQVVVEYAVIGDTLLIWTLRDTAVRLTRTTINRDRLLYTIATVRSLLESCESDAAVLPAMQALYEWLIRPIHPHLGPSGTTLVLIANDELEGIPFSTLYDGARRRHLIEDYLLRSARSLREAVRKPRNHATPADTVLLISNPAFVSQIYPGLTGLEGAEAEVDTVAAEYRKTIVLKGADANRVRIEASLPWAKIIHYAGHAVADSVRPNSSYLVLAPSRARVDYFGRLPAMDMELLDLRHVRLVVLASCQTFRSRDWRMGGLPAPADAVLNAGADGVVGSLWRVNDQLTRALMIRFHRAYRETGDPARALRIAQLALLRSNDPDLRSPAAWAAFKYMGS